MAVATTLDNTFGIDVRDSLARDRYAVISADSFNIAGLEDELSALYASWDNLGPDPFFGGGEQACRTRRYSDFEYDPADNSLTPLDHVAYYQSKGMNAFVGGKERHFEDVEISTVKNKALLELVRLDFENLPIEPKYLEQTWICQIHQIRIAVNPGQTYDVVPEGVHSDGYPFAGLHLIRKHEVEGAENVVYTWEEEELARTVLSSPLDTLIFEDKKMKHYASPLTAGPDGGVREILAISFSLPGTEYETIR